MEQTLVGLGRPHRHVLDDAQLHIYMLMKKVGAPRHPARELGSPWLSPAARGSGCPQDIELTFQSCQLRAGPAPSLGMPLPDILL